MKKLQKINRKKPPKMFWGGLTAITGLMGAGASLFGAINGANAQEKLAEEQRKERERENKLKKIEQDTDVLRTYPTAGRNTSYYKHGGYIPKLSEGGDDEARAERQTALLERRKQARAERQTVLLERRKQAKSAPKPKKIHIGFGDFLKETVKPRNLVSAATKGFTAFGNTAISPISMVYRAARGRKVFDNSLFLSKEENNNIDESPYEAAATQVAATILGAGAAKYAVAPILRHTVVPLGKKIISGVKPGLKSAYEGIGTYIGDIGTGSTKAAMRRVNKKVGEISLKNVPESVRPDLRTMLMDAGYKPRPQTTFWKGKVKQVQGEVDPKSAIKFIHPDKVTAEAGKQIRVKTPIPTPKPGKPAKVYTYKKADGNEATVTVPFADRGRFARARINTAQGITSAYKGTVNAVSTKVKPTLVDIKKDMVSTVKSDINAIYRFPETFRNSPVIPISSKVPTPKPKVRNYTLRNNQYLEKLNKAKSNVNSTDNIRSVNPTSKNTPALDFRTAILNMSERKPVISEISSNKTPRAVVRRLRQLSYKPLVKTEIPAEPKRLAGRNLTPVKKTVEPIKETRITTKQKLKDLSYKPSKIKISEKELTIYDRERIASKLRNRSYSPYIGTKSSSRFVPKSRERMSPLAKAKYNRELDDKIINKYITSGENSYGTSVELMENLRTNPFIRETLRKRYKLAYGGSSDSQLPSKNKKKINAKAELITNAKGTTSGTHEQGYDIPVKRGGKTTAYVEPGEVALDTPNGSKYILSKRTGFAQRYMDLEQKRQTLARYAKRGGSLVKLELDKVIQEMNRLPKEQEEINRTLPAMSGNRKGYGDPPKKETLDEMEARHDEYFLNKFSDGSNDMDLIKRVNAARAKYANKTSSGAITPQTSQTSSSTNPRVIRVSTEGFGNYYDDKLANDDHYMKVLGNGKPYDPLNPTDEQRVFMDILDKARDNRYKVIEDPSLNVKPSTGTSPKSNKPRKTTSPKPTVVQNTSNLSVEDENAALTAKKYPNLSSEKTLQPIRVFDRTREEIITEQARPVKDNKPFEISFPPMKSSPIPTNKPSKFKSAFKSAFNSENIGTTMQGIGALADVAGMIYSNNKLKNLKTPPPIIIPKGGYNTRYDDSAERANLADTTRQAMRRAKYSSGLTSDAEMQKILAQSWGQSNAIAGNKFNMETQLRNEAFAKDSRVNELNAISRSAYKDAEYARRYQTNVANPQQITSSIATHLGSLGNKLDVRNRDQHSMVTSAMSTDNASFEALAKAGYFNNLDMNLLKAISPEKYAILSKFRK